MAHQGQRGTVKLSVLGGLFYCPLSNRSDSNMTRRIAMREKSLREFYQKVMGTSLLLPLSDEAEETEDSTEQEEDE